MIGVAGATGYVGRLLTYRLLELGSDVRCLARDPAKAEALAEAGAEVVRADVLEPETLTAALTGVELAYYLVHSMGRGSGGDFVAHDRAGARNFGTAAREAGVERIVYLGGLGEGPSKHLRSRHETALELERSSVPLTYFRAAIVIGAGSESFRTIYYLVKRLPMMVTPRWTENRTQPIAIGDVLEYLSQAAETEASVGRTIEIGGPEVTTYGGLMDAMADALGVRRRTMISVPVLSPGLSSRWIGLVTPVDAGVARPLVEGLATDTIVTDPSGMELFQVDPTPVAEAMRAAVAEVE